MKVFVIIVALIVLAYWWMVFNAMDWDPSWDEPMQEDTDEQRTEDL